VLPLALKVPPPAIICDRLEVIRIRSSIDRPAIIFIASRIWPKAFTSPFTSCGSVPLPLAMRRRRE